jgi:hypothetical protein
MQTSQQREQELRAFRQRRRYGDPLTPEQAEMVKGLARLAIELNRDALREFERHEASVPLSRR